MGIDKMEIDKGEVEQMEIDKGGKLNKWELTKWKLTKGKLNKWKLQRGEVDQMQSCQLSRILFRHNLTLTPIITSISHTKHAVYYICNLQAPTSMCNCRPRLCNGR